MLQHYADEFPWARHVPIDHLTSSTLVTLITSGHTDLFESEQELEELTRDDYLWL